MKAIQTYVSFNVNDDISVNHVNNRRAIIPPSIMLPRYDVAKQGKSQEHEMYY